jgi:aspartyl/glutamyl-tRNA(Asn/Gln) amidotransferase C subunit
MSENIDPKLFAHLVDLAALQLDEKEAEYLRAELNKQLQAIDELAAIPLDENTPAASHGVPYPKEIRPAFREDKIADSKEADDILKQAPASEDRYIVVPDIPREKLK